MKIWLVTWIQRIQPENYRRSAELQRKFVFRVRSSFQEQWEDGNTFERKNSIRIFESEE